jgi:hypothetical protein
MKYAMQQEFNSLGFGFQGQSILQALDFYRGTTPSKSILLPLCKCPSKSIFLGCETLPLIPLPSTTG